MLYSLRLIFKDEKIGKGIWEYTESGKQLMTAKDIKIFLIKKACSR